MQGLVRTVLIETLARLYPAPVAALQVDRP
jgi:hypothetical protein